VVDDFKFSYNVINNPLSPATSLTNIICYKNLQLTNSNYTGLVTGLVNIPLTNYNYNNVNEIISNPDITYNSIISFSKELTKSEIDLLNLV